MCARARVVCARVHAREGFQQVCRLLHALHVEAPPREEVLVRAADAVEAATVLAVPTALAPTRLLLLRGTRLLHLQLCGCCALAHRALKSSATAAHPVMRMSSGRQLRAYVRACTK